MITTPARVTLAKVAVLGACPFLIASCSPDAASPQACTDGEGVLDVGFYAFFAPVSYSADPDPASAGCNTHLGYESNLLTAVEAMEGTGLSFSRQGIAAWPDI